MDLASMLKGHVKRGDFTLSSGKKSSYYVDIKRAYTDPAILKEISKEMAKFIRRAKPDRIAGIAVGSIPIATALSLETGVPFIIVRKDVKEHGTHAKIEGELAPGMRVVVVEDVATTGNSALAAVDAIRESKGICDTVLVVVDREEGAEENLSRNGVALRSLAKAEEIASAN